jgi:urease accessory protein
MDKLSQAFRHSQEQGQASRTTLDARASHATAEYALQRARGRARLAVRLRGSVNAVANLAQEGSARLLFPARAPHEPVEAIIANTSGGLTGGDRFEVAARVGSGASAVLTTQACEKIYRSGPRDGAGRVSSRLKVDSRGVLYWLPQETILFEASRLERRLDADVAEDASLLIAEAIILGRAAMGETLARAAFRDSWRIRREGRLVFAEETACDGAWVAARGAKACFDGAGAMATLLLAGREAEAKLDGARAILDSHPIDGGASLVDGLVIVRLVAGAGLALRQVLVPLIEHLGGRSLPRVWTT